MRRSDLWILIQASGDDSISTGRKDVVENFVGPNTARRRGFVKPFVVIRHDFSRAQQEIRMMAGLIAPGETSRAGGLSRKCCLQLKRFARAQMRQDKVQLPGGA